MRALLHHHHQNQLLLVLTGLLLLIGCCGGGAFQAHASESVVYELPEQPPTSDQPLFVTFRNPYGAAFNESTLVYLADNVTQCSTGTVFTSVWPTEGPPVKDQVGAIRQWTDHDPKTEWRVRFDLVSMHRTTHESASGAFDTLYVCFSRDKGLTWKQAINSHGRSFFRVWRGLPTAYLTPATVVVHRNLYITVKNVPKFSKLGLVTDKTACNQGAGFKYNASLEEGTGYTFTVVPEQTGYTYICLSGHPYDHWSLIPVDQTGLDLTYSVGQDKNGPTYAVPKDGLGFWVYPETVAQHPASVSCTTIIAGARVTCTISLNSTIATGSISEDLTFDSLTDGAGVEECPYPPIRPGETEGTFTFTYIPQRHGREGNLKLRYQNRPLFINWNSLSEEYYTILEANSSTHNFVPSTPYPSHERDMATMKFFVQPEFSFIQNFDYRNYMNLDYLEPKAGFVFADGVPPTRLSGRTNGTLDMEARTISLASGHSSGTASQTVDIPGNALDCKVSTHYYFTGETLDEYASQIVGSWTVTAVDAAGTTDIAVLQKYEMYSSLRKIVITGSHKADILDGDIKHNEQLIKHFSVLPSYKKIRLDLFMDDSIANKLYFSQISMKCVTTAPKTHPDDILGLQTLYNALSVPSSKTISNWETTPGSGEWNGDPCTNHWSGVICRHFRVISIQLPKRQLQGTIPSGLGRMNYLEDLDLSGNVISGDIPADFRNFTRLKSLNLGTNSISGVASDHVFGYPWNKCLNTLILRHNSMDSFPRQALDLPQLKKLDLSHNVLRDNIPHMDESNQVIEHLDVNSNYLVGELPRLRSTTIKSADFSGNKFNGTVPQQWSALQAARFLDVSNNQLHGALPNDLVNIRTANKMVFRSVSNRHTGLIPHYPFHRVDVRGNLFRCPLPFDYSWVVNNIVGLESDMKCDWYDPEAADPTERPN